MGKFLINRWAYARPYSSTAQRSAALAAVIDTDNRRRPQGDGDGARPIDWVRQ